MLPRGTLLRLLAGVLLLQTLLAPLRCLAHGAGHHFAALLASDDASRSAPSDDQQEQGQATQPANRATCSCGSFSAALRSLVPGLQQTLGIAAPPGWDGAASPSLRAGSRAPPFEATGPPVLLNRILARLPHGPCGRRFPQSRRTPRSCTRHRVPRPCHPRPGFRPGRAFAPSRRPRLPWWPMRTARRT